MIVCESPHFYSRIHTLTRKVLSKDPFSKKAFYRKNFEGAKEHKQNILLSPFSFYHLTVV